MSMDQGASERCKPKRHLIPLNGWLALDKPEGISSTQAMAKARWLFGAQKAGHGGTLDPLASGLLPVAFGEATKTVAYAMDGAKVYRALAHFGTATTTDDREGTVTALCDKRPTRQEIEAHLPAFMGMIAQVPPAYSAIKVAGERAYALAREGRQVALTARCVQVDAFALLEMGEDGLALFEVRCGKGVYIRSLIRDLALSMGCVAHLAGLRRLVVGPFDIAKAISLDALERAVADESNQAVTRWLQPVAAPLAGLPHVTLTADQAARFRCGQAIPWVADAQQGSCLVTLDGVALGIGHCEQGLVRPARLLHL
jgi:tRNA pseudouridine55 synthase